MCPSFLPGFLGWDHVSRQVSIDGMYRLPQKLLEAGGPLPEPGTAEGPLETHPFRSLDNLPPEGQVAAFSATSCE